MDWWSGYRDQVRGGVHVEACDNNTVDGGANLLRSSFFWLVLREVLPSSHLCMDTLTESMAHNIFNGASSQLVLWRNHLTEDAGVYSEWRGLKLSKRENKLMIYNKCYVLLLRSVVLFILYFWFKISTKFNIWLNYHFYF